MGQIKTAEKSVRLGQRFRSVIADANALWQVMEKHGTRAWICEVVNEPITVNGKTYPGDYAGTRKAFLTNEILSSVNWENSIQNSMDENDRYYRNLKVGETLHYHDGFDRFVRCVVVVHEGKQKLKRVALVGDWKLPDLPKRRYNGDIDFGYHAERVLKGELFDPHYSNIYESPGFTRKDVHDPRSMKPVKLDVPPMTPEHQVAASYWKILERIREFTDPSTVAENMNIFDSAAPLAALRKIKQMVQDI